MKALFSMFLYPGLYTNLGKHLSTSAVGVSDFNIHWCQVYFSDRFHPKQKALTTYGLKAAYQLLQAITINPGLWLAFCDIFGNLYVQLPAIYF